ncbi:MAG: M23 family metallopeptidase [Deltaproteobacteria bacterium]|nr:M23 family metallopeptidase [Deltaproteobacteria bacterium]
MKLRLILLLIVIIAVPIVFITTLRMESEKPSITIESMPDSVGASGEILLKISDAKSGIRNIKIGLIQDGEETTLYKKEFSASSLTGSGYVLEEPVKIIIDPKKRGLSDGKALLRVAASDYSWRDWWHGNRAYLEKSINIDTKPPEIEILSHIHNITQGGAGLIVYRLPEPCLKTGVMVGENFFPGQAGYSKDQTIVIAFFALDYKQGKGTKLYVQATDKAGNCGKAGFPYYIKARKFKQDIINISDSFLGLKMPEFESNTPAAARSSMKDIFLNVNNRLRKANFEKIAEIVKKTDRILYWKGTFSRLPKSANRAGFADHRSYKYNGKIIDHQIHLGIDLASVAHSPVPAANKGRVAFTGPIGIYGKTVIIDHGFGLFSMYSHLSNIAVQKDQILLKGETLGRTGTTGLAGGDHLHFSILIDNVFVNPLEWWDGVWIKNNISSKLALIKN